MHDTCLPECAEKAGLGSPHMDLALAEFCRSSVTKSCPTVCNPMGCSTPGFLVLHYLPEFAQTYVHWVSDAIQPSRPVARFSCPQSFLALGSLPVSQLLESGGQSIGASVSASVFPMNIQGWFPLGLTGLISFQAKGLSRVFCSATACSFR